MRTYDRQTIEAARDSWVGFGWQWQSLRRIAADRGFLYAPSGSSHDDRDAESPSQRAIVWRALVDNPTTTETIVRRSRSWSQVVDGIIGLESTLRDDADERTRDVDWERKGHPTGRQATSSLKAILDRIGDS